MVTQNQVPPELQNNVHLMPWDKLYNWSRKRSLWALALGALGAEIVSALIDDFRSAVTPQAVALATIFSAAVGFFFGIYPARRASLLNPIDALRYE